MPTPTRNRRRPIVHVQVRGDLIVVDAPYSLKETSKQVPALTYHKPSRTFRARATPAAATNILTVYREANVELRFGADFEALVDQHRVEHAAAQRRKNAENPDPLPVPTQREPWTHQLQAFWFARAMPAAMLAMDMGCGKTKVAFDLLCANDARRVLVVCPPGVVDVWPKEHAKNSGLHFECVPLPKKTSVTDRKMLAETLYHSDTERVLFSINYQAIIREPFQSWATSVEWDYVILDECHKIKAPNGALSKTAAKLCAKAKHRLGLTGTPMPQIPLDIYGQYRALDPDIYGTSWTAFKARYAIYGGYENRTFKRLNERTEDEFNERFYSIAFRVDADDVLDLPPSVDEEVFCSLEGRQARIYAAIDSDFHAFVGDGQEVTPANTLVQILRLQQITGGAVNDDDGNEVHVGDAKAALLKEHLEDIPPDEPVAVFCWFVHDLDQIAAVAEDVGRPYGEVSGRRSDLVEACMPDVPGLVLAVQMAAGSEGTDLTRARFGTYYSLGYRLDLYLQSRRRLLRPGQERPVTFTHLIASGTKDVEVYDALEAREDVVDYVLRRMALAR